MVKKLKDVMKKKSCFLLLLLLPFSMVSQALMTEGTITKEKAKFKNQIDLGVQFLGGEISYKRRVKNNFFVGAGFNLGFNYLLGNHGFLINVYSRYHLVLDYEHYNMQHYYAGFLYSPYVYVKNSDNGGSFKGLLLGLFEKGRKIDYGIELSWGVIDEGGTNLFTISSSLLVIKIPINRW